jgi:hypothetical protein
MTTEFRTPVDVGNRALQHCGAEMMDPTLGFAEISKRARQISFAYGKLRVAELQRNNWVFSIREAVLRAIDTTTMLLVPSMWVSSTTYFLGSIVSDQNRNLWISNAPNNLGNQPEDSPLWEPYFGPMTVSLFSATVGYFAGELVYTAAGDGTYRVFLSMQNVNLDNPATATAWDPTVTYFKNQVVAYASVAYMSLVDLNTNQQPSLSPAPWNAATVYAAGAKAGGSDGTIYQSVGSGNLGHDPTEDTGVYWTNTGVLTPWTTIFVGGSGSDKWLQVGGAEFPMGVGLTVAGIVYPLGSGPSTQTATRNAFRLPAGFLRKAPQDPKAGSLSYLGAPANIIDDDWLFEGDYIVSAQNDPIRLRFTSDMTDVSRMNAMFCEGLAARIAEAVCEPLTQSTAKLGAITQAYKTVMFEARTVNAVEAGSEEPPLDDYIACRA